MEPADNGRLGDWIKEQLACAEIRCRSRGERLTARRREILALLLQCGRSVKAYDLLYELHKKHPQAGPTAVYRPLRFLIAQGLAARVPSLNAYVACKPPLPPNTPGFLIVCSGCFEVEQMTDLSALGLLSRRLLSSGYQLEGSVIEVTAICRSCAAHLSAKA
jgi:Fur family zinc uptake transcriptional regulator